MFLEIFTRKFLAGIFVTTTVVISFHPLFVTKVDRAYRVQCFYMEADKTVSTQIEVSEITTAFQTQIVPMPVCRYEACLFEFFEFAFIYTIQIQT